jgi:hypothetical protein
MLVHIQITEWFIKPEMYTNFFLQFNLEHKWIYRVVTSARSCNKVRHFFLIYNAHAARDQRRHSVYSVMQ